MPIVIINKTFLDNFGNALTYYQSNVGDRQNITLEVETNIRLSSVGNPILIDISTGQHTSTSQSWLQEGFRVGDTINVTKYAQDGTTILTWIATINFVDDSILDISPNQTGGYDVAAGEFMVYKVLGRNRDDLDVLFNHVANGQQGNEFSLLDAEATRLIFPGVDSLAVSGTINAILPVNQSGQNVISASIQRLPDPPAPNVEVKKIYQISVDFQTSGFYDQSLFNSSNCLKVYMRLEWSSISGEPYDRTKLIFNDDANTGFLNEPFNNGIAAATLIQGIDELDYCNPSTHDIVIDGLVTDLGIGGAYVSIDDSYFKNRPTPGQKQLMLAPSSNVFLAPFPWTLISNTNEAGAGYLIDINSVNTIGTQTTINITFTPQPLFTQFMDGRDDGDRLFYLWIKADNINLLAYSDQLFCEPAVGGPLNMVQSHAFLDHSQNVETATGDNNNYEFDTEDDLGYIGTFLLDKGQEIERFEVEILAENGTTGADFNLLLATFNFSGVQISNDGRYLLDEAQTIVSTLPNTSVKRVSKLTLEPGLDTPTQYGVKIYFPFLSRWEYWLQQLNASVDFWPNQNKNWFQYSENALDWSTRLKLTLVKDGLAFTHFRDFSIKDYNDNKDINSEIELERISTAQIVNIIPEGELFRVIATHEQAGSWDQLNTWGMITVEPYESARRWICSTTVAFDNDALNPLKPLTGSFATLTFPTAQIAQVECLFDSNLINLSNGVKFTAKIKELQLTIEKTTSPDDQPKQTTDLDDKTLAP